MSRTSPAVDPENDPSGTYTQSTAFVPAANDAASGRRTLNPPQAGTIHSKMSCWRNSRVRAFACFLE